MLYRYLNVNPQLRKEPDCVTRAISLATNTDYYLVLRLLLENADIYSCDELCVDCYSHMLTDDIGYVMHNGEGRTVSQIVDMFPDKTLLLRLEGHLTCAVKGILYDIWDCSGEVVDVYWIVE